MTTNGVVVASPERVLAHAIGHAGDQQLDDGPTSSNNVDINENPIVTALGLAPRLGYQLPPPPAVPAQIEDIEKRRPKK